MNPLIQHPILSAVVAYVAVAVVESIPKPGDPRPFWTKVYDTLYTSAHLLANKAIEKKPSLAMPDGVK